MATRGKERGVLQTLRQTEPLRIQQSLHRVEGVGVGARAEVGWEFQVTRRKRKIKTRHAMEAKGVRVDYFRPQVVIVTVASQQRCV